jgi:hypothetical protein
MIGLAAEARQSLQVPRLRAEHAGVVVVFLCGGQGRVAEDTDDDLAFTRGLLGDEGGDAVAEQVTR